MITDLRKTYNEEFTQEKYQAFLQDIYNTYNHIPQFRIAESPLFISKSFQQQLFAACDEITDVICQPDFKELSKEAIKHPDLQVPGEDYHTRFLQVDFGICRDEDGSLFPQLIEVQGFPSVYFFQDLLSSTYRKHFSIPADFTVHSGGLDAEAYVKLFKKIIVGDNDPKNVILLEVEPEKQNTYIDFLGAQAHLGIKVLCISKLIKRGKKLFYLDDAGKEIPVHKIYNRVIFDELNQRNDLKREFYFKDEVDVEWVGHPNWFFRISKYILPLLKGKYIPESFYLDQLKEYPEDLHNYVLKPLYSFSGAGVKLHITAADLDAIEHKHDFIIQRKVNYEPILQTPSGPAKCEVRLLMLWEHGDPKPQVVNNLVRLSKGEMIGVKYNKDKDWVGASVGFFEP